MLEALSNAFGPSGCEGEVRDLIIEAIKDDVDDYNVDHLGNLLAFKRGAKGCSGKRMTIMVAAHMDEVGFMITRADGDGFLHFTNVGGIDARVLPTKRVKIGPKKIQGIIISPPVHVLSAEKRKKVTPANELVIDIGVEKKDAAEGKCPKGSYAAFDTVFRKLGRGMVCGKAFDDRVGCAMLIELLKRGPYPVDICAAFTTMEEVGLRGARVAGYEVKPDAAFVLEGTICEDSPKERETCSVTQIGGGPAITLVDGNVIVNRKLAKFAQDRAAARGIPCHIKRPGVGGTDAGAIQHSGIGVPTLPVSVPVRYIHSPASVLSLKDVSLTVDLVEDLIRKITPKTIKG
jgi:endoglucanase